MFSNSIICNVRTKNNAVHTQIVVFKDLKQASTGLVQLVVRFHLPHQ